MKTLLRWLLAVIGAAILLYSGSTLVEILGIQASLREEEGFAIQLFGREFTPMGYALLHTVLFLAAGLLVVAVLRTGREKAPNQSIQPTPTSRRG